jgi:hypothetical protein
MVADQPLSLWMIGELETVQKAGSGSVASGSLANFFYGSDVSQRQRMTKNARDNMDNNFRKTFPFQFGRCQVEPAQLQPAHTP